MTIKSELIQLQIRHGILKPEIAVAWAAAHPKSKLHGALEWDDTRAAEQFRIWQVRHLIAVHVVDKTGARQVVSLSIDRTETGGYRALDDVMASPPLREVLLADALAELERVRLKYQGLVELARIWTEVRLAKTKQAKRSGAQQKVSRVRQSRAKQAKRSGAKLRHEQPRPAMQA